MYHAVIVIFLEFFAWGLLTAPTLVVSNPLAYLSLLNLCLPFPGERCVVNMPGNKEHYFLFSVGDHPTDRVSPPSPLLLGGPASWPCAVALPQVTP